MTELNKAFDLVKQSANVHIFWNSPEDLSDEEIKADAEYIMNELQSGPLEYVKADSLKELEDKYDKASNNINNNIKIITKYLEEFTNLIDKVIQESEKLEKEISSSDIKGYKKDKLGNYKKLINGIKNTKSAFTGILSTQRESLDNLSHVISIYIK